MQIAELVAYSNGFFSALTADGRLVDLTTTRNGQHRVWVNVETPARLVKLALNTGGQLYGVDEAGNVWQRDRDYVVPPDPREPGSSARIAAAWHQVTRSPA